MLRTPQILLVESCFLRHDDFIFAKLVKQLFRLMGDVGLDVELFMSVEPMTIEDSLSR